MTKAKLPAPVFHEPGSAGPPAATPDLTPEPADRTWPGYVPPFPDWIKLEVKLVTPPDARRYLEEMGANRKRSELDVGVHAANLRDDSFYPEISPAYLNDADRALDAQHRLAAIAETNIAAYMVFIRGVRPEAEEYIDASRARSMADAQKIAGTVEYTRQTVIARALALYTRYGIDGLRNPSSYPVTRRQMDTWIDDNGVLAAIKAGRALHSAVGANANWSAVAMLITGNGADPDGFWEKVRTGAELKAGDPALTLHNWLMRGGRARRTQADPRLMELYAYATAWNKHVLGRDYAAVSPTFERKITKTGKEKLTFPARNVPDFLPLDPAEREQALAGLRSAYGGLKGARRRIALSDAGLDEEDLT